MKVKELITLLSKEDPEALALVYSRDQEGGGKVRKLGTDLEELYYKADPPFLGDCKAVIIIGD